MRKSFTLFSCSAAIALASGQLIAQEEKDTKLWTGSVELGYVDTSGNTEESTLKTAADLNRERDKWRYKVVFNSLNSEKSGERSAEKYFISNRLAYQYTETNYVFGYASYDDDRFSGFDYQATVSAGYGRRLLNDESMQWDIEIGPGYRVSKVEDEAASDDEEEAIIAHIFTKYLWNVSDTAEFTQTATVDAGSDNTISKSVTALKVQIVGAVAMKLSYTVKYSEEVPVDTKHADTETAVTFTYSF